MSDTDYLGYCPHGVLMFWAEDAPELRSDNARDVASLIRKGWNVQRGSHEIARRDLDTCNICKPKGKK